MTTILPSLRKLEGGVPKYRKKYNLPDTNSKTESITKDENKRLENLVKNPIHHYSFSAK